MSAAVTGAGPAGLMAAEVLSRAGEQVDVYDAMPSAGRKFLLAGIGGLNLTHAEAFDDFVSRFGARAKHVEPWLRAFGPQAVRDWAAGLGVETFVGTSNRVFPTGMKAAPLLRAWVHRLRAAGVRFHMRHEFTGWTPEGKLRFVAPEGEVLVQAQACVLAMGGASWPRLGSDGAWADILRDRGATIAPLLPANCGFDVRGGWSNYFRERFAGQPFKSVALRFEGFAKQGEFVATEAGVEGSLVYAASALLRDRIERDNAATFELDLLPGKSAEQVAREVAHPRGSRSLPSHLKSRLSLDGIKLALLHELLPAGALEDSAWLAAAIKALPVTLVAARPVAEAISTAGGVTFESMNEVLMLQSAPGVFCAGEMIDWEAPTGGYLLTACLASGRTAGEGATAYLRTLT